MYIERKWKWHQIADILEIPKGPLLHHLRTYAPMKYSKWRKTGLTAKKYLPKEWHERTR